MLFEEKQILITKTARYCTYGNLSENTKSVWLVCHGYRQLATSFIKKFEALNPEENFVIAPEALSKFYIEGFTGRVGAAWMTRESRETEIADYVRYLTQLYQTVLGEIPYNNLKINILGFSQGATTASRWILNSDIKFDRLILWAGNFPHDADFQVAFEKLQHKALVFVYGNEDEFLSEKTVENHLDMLNKHQLYPKVVQFEGKHDMHTPTLLSLAD